MRPSVRRYSCARASAAALVRAPGTSSTSGMISGGLSGWATRPRSCRRQRANRSLGGSPLDELVTTASAGAIPSIASNSRCFAIRSSLIASITQSASCTVRSRLRPGWNSPRPLSTTPWGARSKATSARARRGTSVRARSRVRELLSNIVTGHPAEAHRAAQPEPMSPAPMTATLRGRVTRPRSWPVSGSRAARGRTAGGAPGPGGRASRRASARLRDRSACGRGCPRRPGPPRVALP